MKRILSFLVVILIIMASCGCKKGDAPDFTVTDWEGNNISLSDFRGKAVVLNFWASWCPPCKAEMPDFEEAYLEYGDEVVFMMVSCYDGQRETVEKAKSHIESCGYTFPVYFDVYFEGSYAYNVDTIPRTFFISPDGNILMSERQAIELDDLVEGIELILNEK